MATVRTRLILTGSGSGRSGRSSSGVKGKAARGGWLVRARAMTLREDLLTRDQRRASAPQAAGGLSRPGKV